MIKIFDSQETNKEYSEFFNVGDSSLPLVKELLKREDYSEYSFTIGDSEEKISMSDVFIFQINIKDSSSVYSAFKLEKFPKDEIINKVAMLKDINIVDIASSKYKTSELFKILKEYQPYFIIYQSKNGFPLLEKEIREMVESLEMNEVSFFYIERELSKFGEFVKVEEKKEEEKPQEVDSITVPPSEDIKIEDVVLEEEKVEEEQPVVEETPEVPVTEAVKKEKPVRKKIDWKKYAVMDIGNIRKNKYHFIFLTVSAFLFGFASSIGFCNALLAKAICALFFVCAGVGVFLNTYVFVDYLKERTYKDRLFVYSLIFEVIGFGLSYGATFIFYGLDKGEIKNGVNASLLAGVTAAMCFGMACFSIGVSYLIDFIERKVKAKKAKENEAQ